MEELGLADVIVVYPCTSQEVQWEAQGYVHLSSLLWGLLTGYEAVGVNGILNKQQRARMWREEVE
jgi:hypothetical protein